MILKVLNVIFLICVFTSSQVFAAGCEDVQPAFSKDNKIYQCKVENSDKFACVQQGTVLDEDGQTQKALSIKASSFLTHFNYSLKNETPSLCQIFSFTNLCSYEEVKVIDESEIQAYSYQPVIIGGFGDGLELHFHLNMADAIGGLDVRRFDPKGTTLSEASYDLSSCVELK